MHQSLEDHVAIVTGASRGIGRACAERLAAEGCHIVAASRSPGPLERTAERCRDHGVEARVVETDVSDRDDVRMMVDHCRTEFGKINILVNNAGINPHDRVDEADLAAWDRAVDTNLKGMIYTTRFAAPDLKLASGDGDCAAIVNIGSISGTMSFPEGGVYCATKHGVVGLTGSTFEDLRESGVKVSVLNPGYVDTAMSESDNLDSDKMIQPEDIAHTALFVATFPETGCPTEIIVRPQRSPYLT